MEVGNEDSDDKIWEPPTSWAKFTSTGNYSDSSDCDSAWDESEDEDEPMDNAREIRPEQLENVTGSQPKPPKRGKEMYCFVL